MRQTTAWLLQLSWLPLHAAFCRMEQIHTGREDRREHLNTRAVGLPVYLKILSLKSSPSCYKHFLNGFQTLAEFLELLRESELGFKCFVHSCVCSAFSTLAGFQVTSQGEDLHIFFFPFNSDLFIYTHIFFVHTQKPSSSSVTWEAWSRGPLGSLCQHLKRLSYFMTVGTAFCPWTVPADLQWLGFRL